MPLILRPRRRVLLSGAASSTPPSGPATPTFVHANASDLNDNNGITGNNYIFSPTNASQSGNTILLAVAYPFNASRTRAIADSTTATWGSPIGTAGTASTGHLNLAIYALPNVAAALHILTYTFDAELKPFWYEVVEFYNVAPVSPADGFQGQVVAGPSISAGSYTPSTNNDANGGHLIFTVAISDDTIGTTVGTQASAMSATGSATLIHANNVCTIPQISSYFVQTTNGAINPGFSITQSSGTNFVVASVALKAGISGSDLPAGIKVRKILHYSLVNPTSGNNLVLFPCIGNLRVASMAADNSQNTVNSMTDTAGKTYTSRGSAGISQIFDVGNVAGADGLGINLNLNAGEPQFTLHLWDVADADPNPFDTTANFTGAAPSSTTITDFPDITPGTSHTLTIAQGSFGTASQGSMAAGAPAGAIFDGVAYTTSAPLFDQDRMDNADPFGHVVSLTALPQTWNYHITSATFGSTAFATACTYKSA